MKKIFTHILVAAFGLFLMKTSLAQTNVYHPFPNDSAYWGYATSNSGCSSTICPSERVLQMGDTIVNALVYHKVYSQWGTFGPPSNCGASTGSCFTPSTALTLKCLLRQDSAAKKVYVAIPSSVQDTLLYTFDLHLGDTLPKTYAWAGGSYPNGVAVIHQIDSILIDGHYNKVFIIDPSHLSECSFLIEGVGSSTDLLSMGCGLGSYKSLTCFNNSGIQFGPGSTGCGSYAIAGIESIRPVTRFQIVPNPSTGYVHLDLPTEAISVRVVDVYGKEIVSQRVATLKTELDLGQYDNGVYLVEVRTNQETLTQKIMLAH